MGPGPLSVRQPRLTVPAYFQGAGAGSGPFLQGAGAGSGPFLHGAGAGSGPFLNTGIGAAPFAMMNEPSPCAATAVFRPIAPTRTSIGSNRTKSLRDIAVPPREGKRKPRDALYIKLHYCQVAPGCGPAANRYTPRPNILRQTFASREDEPNCDRTQDKIFDMHGQRYSSTRGSGTLLMATTGFRA